MDLREAIERRAIPEPNSGCWLWPGVDTGDGYIRASVCGTVGFVHRISYRAFKGEITNGLFVRHKCDVRCCVNPAHLELGTHAENMRDRSDRKLSRKGISRDDVREIFVSTRPKARLAREYNISRSMVRLIQQRKVHAGKTADLARPIDIDAAQHWPSPIATKGE